MADKKNKLPDWEDDYRHCKRTGKDMLAEIKAANSTPANTSESENAQLAEILEMQLRPPELSDDALALEYVDQTDGKVRYVARAGTWYRWIGTVWAPDDTLYVYNDVRQVCRAAAMRLEKPQKFIASATTVSHVERMARSDRRVSAKITQWDSDPWLLNTPDCTINLKTGERKPNAATDYITKTTAIGPGNDGCPMFLKFLDEITKDNKELQAYLQRIFGYCLTGSIREHAMFFFYGHGANGKSVLLETVAGTMQGYREVSDSSTFTHSKTDRHPTELAKLLGARLVTAIETEEGRRWNESRIKSLTGGDVITARFMRCDFFDFAPEFKIIVAGNHKPSIRTVDVAIERRFNLVPFTVNIPKEKQDDQLVEKLKAEWPGILQWMVEGCLAWQEKGLNPPQIVRDATSDYLASEDTIKNWMDERCEISGELSVDTSKLFEDFRTWCDDNKEFAPSQKEFSEKLAVKGDALGFHKKKKHGVQTWIGIGLRPRKSDWTDY